MVGLEKRKINGFHPWSKETKHPKKDCDPSYSLKDETLDHASHPKKIGIISSGSLSNNILDHLKEEYPDLLTNRPYETYIENFKDLLLPNQAEDSTEDAYEQKGSDDIETPSPSEDDSQLTQDIKECDPKTPAKFVSDDGLEDNIICDSHGDEEYIFEPDVPSQINDDSIGIEDTSQTSNSDITHEHHSEVLTDPHDKIQHQSGNDLEHHPSLRMRAHNIFVELKKKLGLGKGSHVEEKDQANRMHSTITEPDHDRINQSITHEVEANASKSIPNPNSRSSNNTSSDHGSSNISGQILSSSDNIAHKQNHAQVTNANKYAHQTQTQTQIQKQPDPKTYEFKAISKSSPQNSKSDLHLIGNQDIHQRVTDLKTTMDDMDIIFIITCLDDVNDIENTNLLIDLADKMGILSIVVASLPRYFGRVDNVRSMNKVLHNMRMAAGMVILLPYFGAFEFGLVPDLIKELMELITEPGLINVDIADIKMVVRGGNVGVITFGSGRKNTRAKDAFFKAIDSELLNVELAGVRKALINVTGGKDMTIGEVEGIAEQLRRRLKKRARLILGARIDPLMSNQLKIFIMLGVTPMQVMVNRYANE